MWVKNAKQDSIVNLNRAFAIGVFPKDADKDEYGLGAVFQLVPAPIILVEGTKALCEARLAELYDHLNPTPTVFLQTQQ
jgi:hypothetical protein